MQGQGEHNHCHCSCPHHLATPVLVFLIGLTFLLGNLNVLNEQITGITWPVLVMVGGVGKAFKNRCKCC
jgi:hypothetical protein